METGVEDFASLQRWSLGVLGLFRVRWRLALTVLTLCLGVATGYAFLATPIYKAQVVLQPVRQSELSGNLNAMLGQFGQLAALAGIGPTTASEDQSAIAILRSRAFGERLIRDLTLLPYLFPERWDQVAGRWRGDPSRVVPTADEAWKRFDEGTRRVMHDLKTGLVTVSITMRDRQVAAKVANAIPIAINHELRERTNEEVRLSRVYLERQLTETQDVELRQSIYRLMELQIRRQVVANARPEFAFAVIDPATVPDTDKFERPRRLLTIVLGALLGVVLAFLIVTISQLFRPIRT